MRGLILYKRAIARHTCVYPLNFLNLGFFENAFEKAKFRSHLLILGQLLKQIDLVALPRGVLYFEKHLNRHTGIHRTRRGSVCVNLIKNSHSALIRQVQPVVQVQVQ